MFSALCRWSSFLLWVALISVIPSSASATQVPPPDKTAAGNPNSAGRADSGDTPQSPDSAQEPSTSDQGGMFVFRKDVEEVILHATVLDERRHLVSGLEPSAFTVLENGVPQPITSFRRQDVPVAMGIVVDNSGSMRAKRDEVNRAVLNLIRASNPQDEIFVVNFSRQYYLDQEFTSDVNLLQAALQQLSSAGTTALYDAVVASALYLKSNPRLDEKVLLVITDGRDNMSQETLDEALRRLQQPNGPTVYAVGLTGGSLDERGRDALQRLAQGTGGVAYFPRTLEQVGDITQTVARDIRSRYIIAYKPSNQSSHPDDRSVDVRARAPGYGKLSVRARRGMSYAGPSSR